MPKRRRLLYVPQKKSKVTKYKYDDDNREVSTARGRLKGALLDALGPTEDSDESETSSPSKRERKESQDSNQKEIESSSEDERSQSSNQRQSYVLKLFDRSVDLSQFNEDSPLYPICRAWIANQPKANYKKFGSSYRPPLKTDKSVDLPGPTGPLVTRIPKLLPEQQERTQESINFNYREAPPPDAQSLLQAHVGRWARVRREWLQQAARREARYEQTQLTLNAISI